MKRIISKQTLGFVNSKVWRCIRTPQDIWENLKEEFDFTLDACASDTNHLLPKYYTKENSCLDKDWTGQVVYCHPMFDSKIGNFVKKAFDSKCTTVMLLPAGTHTKYFHEYIYHNPNCEYRFLRKPARGFNFGNEDGSVDVLETGRIGYIKPLMIVIFRNQPNLN